MTADGEHHDGGEAAPPRRLRFAERLCVQREPSAGPMTAWQARGYGLKELLAARYWKARNARRRAALARKAPSAVLRTRAVRALR